MAWLERIRRGGAPDPRSNQDAEDPGPQERSSPGLAKLFDLLRDDGSHSLLDLGSAGGRQLRLYGRYARQVRFAGLVPRGSDSADWMEDLERMPANPAAPYDVVLAWDVLDRVGAEDRPALLRRLDSITASHARLYAVVDATGAPVTRAISYSMTDIGRVSEERVGPAAPARPPLLPAEVERVLSPFRMLHAFTLRSGYREYLAEKVEGA